MYELDYSQIVRERFEKPRNAGRLFGPVVTGAAGDEARGTWVELDFRVRDGIVEHGRFRAYGCPHAIAAASWVAEAAEGRSLEDTGWLDPHRLAEIMDVPQHKLGVLLVVEDALRAAAAAAREAATPIRAGE